MFTDEKVTDLPGFNKYILKESKKELLILEKAIKENWTINQLIENFPRNLFVVIGSNVSGVNVANLKTKKVCEWSW